MQIKIKTSWLYTAALVLCAAVFLVSAFFLGRWIYENYKSKQLASQLQDMVGTGEDMVQEGGVSVLPPSENSLDELSLEELKAQNSDTVGWIRVSGTSVNYPVVQTDDNDYYLKRDFQHRFTNAGWIYGDYRCNFEDIGANKNLIIYGHGRLDMSMFGSLEYCRRDWWLNNPDYHTIQLATEEGSTTWRVFAVYTTSIDFYYIQTNFSYDGAFLKLVDEMKSRSIHDFGVTVNGDDTIMTLSTCVTDADRLVINAVLVK